MSCHICGRNSCADWMHSEEQQKKFEKVIAAFEKAEDMRQELIRSEEEEEPK